MYQSPNAIVSQIESMCKQLEKLRGEKSLHEVTSVYKTLIKNQHTKNIIIKAVEEFRAVHREYVQYKKKMVSKLEVYKKEAIEFLYELYQLSNSTDLRFSQFLKVSKEELRFTQISGKSIPAYMNMYMKIHFIDLIIC